MGGDDIDNVLDAVIEGLEKLSEATTDAKVRRWCYDAVAYLKRLRMRPGIWRAKGRA